MTDKISRWKSFKKILLVASLVLVACATERAAQSATVNVLVATGSNAAVWCQSSSVTPSRTYDATKKIQFVACPAPTASPTPAPSPSPTPAPTPTPTPTAVAQKVMYQGVTDPLRSESLQSTATIGIARKEVRGFFVKSSDCNTFPLVAPAGVSITVFKPSVITTVNPSYRGAAVGDYFDPLVQTTACIQGWAWIDLAVAATVAPGTYPIQIGDMPVVLKVNSLTMPDRPSTPMYSGLQPYRLLQGHKLPGTTGVDVQGPLVKKYADMMRAHRIEPFGQSPAAPPILGNKLDLDNWSSMNGSFRQTTMDGAIAPVALMTFSGPTSSSYLQAAQATIPGEPGLAGAWYYVQDEPQAADLPALQVKLQDIRSNAPALRTMVTHEPWDGAVGILDHPTPAMQLWKADSRFSNQWIYGACPAHGSCANGYLGNNIGIPDLMIDQPSIHWRMYPLIALATNTKATLYYTVNEGYGQIDPWTNIYLFGGNGDGTLVYPGIPGERGFTEHTPVAGVRMKMIRQGMFDLEYLKLLPPGALAAAVPGPTGWTRDHAVLDNLRAQVAP